MDRLSDLLKQIEGQKEPPVESWNPEHCADMDLIITRSGDWVHEGTKISRPKLVKLFASILKKEGDDYFLVTPVEKVGIKVESTPFIVTTSELIGGQWFMTNNLGEVSQLTGASELDLRDDQNPLILWRRNLPARINQNVMYQWQMHALDNGGLQDGVLYLNSGDDKLVIGCAD